jgi:hypothetical protein
VGLGECHAVRSEGEALLFRNSICPQNVGGWEMQKQGNEFWVEVRTFDDTVGMEDRGACVYVQKIGRVRGRIKART